MAESKLGAQAKDRRYSVPDVPHDVGEEAHDGHNERQNEAGDEVVEQERVLRHGVGLEQEAPKVCVRRLWKRARGRTGGGGNKR